MKYAILYYPRTYHERNYRYFYIPYSILSIATMLDNLIPCRLYDNNVLRCEDPGNLDLPDPTEWASAWVSAMIGMQIVDALKFTAFIKSARPDCPVIWGGACPTLLPELVSQEPNIDYVVIGQGEATAKALWEACAAGECGARIPGVASFVDGKFVRAPSRPLVDLNDLPPYWRYFDLVKIEQYVRSDEHIAPRTVNYHSSQGCPFRCGFCCEPVLWSNRWTGLTGQRIVKDIVWLTEVHGVDGIKFYDSEFFIQKNRVLEFAHEIVRRGLKIRWGASVHPNNLLRFTKENLRLLKASGISRLLVGAETANAAELRFIQKRLKKSAVRQVAHICADLEVSVSFTFVTGYPGFPPSHIDETIEFANELTNVSSLHEAKVHFYSPYPGTPLYLTALDFGFNPPKNLQEWAHYDYYCVNTPWVPEEYFMKVRTFNELHYPYLTEEGTT